jgi:CheY-like chemotaxis protein
MSTILIVEDSPSTREVVSRILRRRGYDVIGASSGREALDAVHHLHPDLVLLDVMMPEIDGMTLLATLHDEPESRDTPVIVLSALSDAGRISRAKELGAKDYLVKTRFSYDDLLDRVEKHVRH